MKNGFSAIVHSIITAEEAETIGQLMDLLHDHINEYELTAAELKTLNDADEILHRLYTFAKE